MIIETTYLCYLVISVALTVWVARTLSTNGRVFLVNSFASDERLADSINHLLVVGFYLINLGLRDARAEARRQARVDAGRHRVPEHEGRARAAGARRHAFLQRVRDREVGQARGGRDPRVARGAVPWTDSLLDRWTDTPVFRALLFFSGCLVLPMLAHRRSHDRHRRRRRRHRASPLSISNRWCSPCCRSVVRWGSSVICALTAPRRRRATQHHGDADLPRGRHRYGARRRGIRRCAGRRSWLTPWGSDVWLGAGGVVRGRQHGVGIGGRRLDAAPDARPHGHARGRRAGGRAFDSLPVVLLLVAIALTTAAVSTR